MRLSIITINYNGSESTIKLLKSLGDQINTSASLNTDKNFQIIVVDNASEETDFNNLEKYYTTYPDTAKVPFVIRNTKNLGFSGGNNVGIREALKRGSDWVVLLNNDTSVGNDFISVLVTKLEGLDGI